MFISMWSPCRRTCFLHSALLSSFVPRELIFPHKRGSCRLCCRIKDLPLADKSPQPYNRLILPWIYVLLLPHTYMLCSPASAFLSLLHAFAFAGLRLKWFLLITRLGTPSQYALAHILLYLRYKSPTEDIPCMQFRDDMSRFPCFSEIPLIFLHFPPSLPHRKWSTPPRFPYAPSTCVLLRLIQGYTPQCF